MPRPGPWRGVSLQFKIGLWVVGGLLLVSALLGYLGLRTLSQSTDRTLDERLLLAETIAGGLDQTLSDRLQQLQEFAASDAIDMEDGDLTPEIEALTELHRYSGPYVTGTFLLDRNGQVLWRTPPAEEPSASILSRYTNVVETLRTNEPRVSGDVYSPTDDSMVVSLSVSIRNDGGQLVGVVGTDFGPASAFIQSLVQPLELGKTGYLEVVNEQGNVLTSTQPGTQVEPFTRTDHAERFVTLIYEGRSVVRTCHRCHENGGEADRREDVMAFAPISTAPWGVAIRQSESEAFALTRDLERNILLFGGLALATTLVAVWLGARAIIVPVKRLTTAAEGIAAGQLDEPIPVSSRDEIGQLARTFETMRQRLKASREQIQRHTTDLERRNRELASLASTAEVVSRSLDIDLLLEEALDKLLETIEAEGGAIFLKQESHGIVLRIQRGLSPEVLRDAERLTLVGAASPDAASMAQTLETIGPSGQAQSACRAPLVSKGEHVGFVLAIRQGRRPFTPDENSLVTAIARQIGMAIGNAALYQETKRREREAQAVYHIGVKISALLDIDKILDTVVASARELLDADVAILTLLDETTDEVYVKSVRTREGEARLDLRLQPGQGIGGKAMALDQPVTSSNYLRDASLTHDPDVDALIRENNLCSFLSVPLNVGGRVLGALVVADQQEAEYSSPDMDVLSRLANQAAIAVENARLYVTAQDMAALEERDRIAREMHDSLSQVLGFLSIESSVVEQKLAAGDLESIKAELAEMRKAARDAYEDVRQSILALRTAGSRTKGLLPGLEEFLLGYRSQSRLAVQVDVVDERATHFSARSEGQLLRIIQEALTNVRKHADATRVTIRFDSHDSAARIAIQDDGRGFEPSHAPRGRHFGLDTMRERAESIGATLLIESEAGSGTQVVVTLPWEEEEANRGPDTNAPGR